MEDDIKAERTEHTNYMENSHLVRTLLTGTKGMRLAGVEYLPKNILESVVKYNARIARSFLFNAYKQTCSFLSGQVFQKEIDFGETESEILQYNDDIDLKGNDTNVFAKRLFFNGLSKGVSHILVEYNAKEAKDSKNEEKEANQRPFFIEIGVDDAFAWVDEKGKIQQLRIRRTKKEKSGKYGIKETKMIVVLEPGIWEEYHEDDKGNYGDTPNESGTTNLDYVPFVSYIPGEETSLLTGVPPLQDLGYLNLKHWQSSSDQNNILHVARVPILFGKGIDIKVFAASVAGLINSDEENADLKYVEITGKAIESGREDLEDTKKEMALYGLQQLIPRVGNMTAKEKTLNSDETNSSLSTWVIEFESFYQKAYEIAADYKGEIFPPNSIDLNKEFLVGFNVEELAKILEAVTMGVTSVKKAFFEFKRRGVFADNYDYEEVQDDIKEENRNDTNFTGIGEDLLRGDDNGNR